METKLTGKTSELEPSPAIFMNWDGKQIESISTQSAMYLSLLQMMKDKKPLPPSLEDKTVSFLGQIKFDSPKDADSFVLEFVPSSFQKSSRAFVKSVAALISVPSKRIRQAAIAFVARLSLPMSSDILLMIVNTDLIPKLISSIDVFSPSFVEAAYTHFYLNKLLHIVFRRSFQHFVETPQYHNPKDHQTLLETLYNNVVLPSYFFVNFLLELLTIAPQHPPTMEFALNMSASE
ncbi:hypothetical protein BLNAU_18896 [Blattamonas nauphoetae]|uniref:Uncharacterized protein n=1 Tax=Blattamonas nauphoetae TaxID=2049346 RepID=A0ABQ9X5H2_9EUKA|nr:hypothetical protein BLNAU_18896 [Blattamonas nauphoetae]